MDRYRRMAILVAVVQSGSIRRAAHELGLTPSAVSQQIRRLEEETFAATHLVTALTPFLKAYPALSLQLVVTDESVDVIRDRIDLAITISRPLRDSSLVRHHLADWALVMCASPAYLAERGTPRTPDDLSAHDLLALPAWHHGSDVLTGPGHGALLPRRARDRRGAGGGTARARPARLVAGDVERRRLDARAEAPAREDPDGARCAHEIPRPDRDSA
jgi:DNA-binding transcriptional LysR family regulator